MTSHHARWQPPQEVVAQVFADEGEFFVPRLNKMVSQLVGYTYSFMPSSQYNELLANDLPRAMLVYWREILYRAHFDACVALIRTQRWIEGALRAASDHNLPAFAATLRGLLESSADTADALSVVPDSLAEAHTLITPALKGKLKQIAVFPDLEDRLIHFAYGRRIERGEEAPATHRAKSTQEYLKVFESEAVGPCYRELCELTHPALSSVLSYSRVNTDRRAHLLSSDTDAELISSFCRTFREAIGHMLAYGIMPCVVTLRTLNEFSFVSVRTAAVADFPVESLNIWQRIRTRLRDPSPPNADSVL